MPERMEDAPPKGAGLELAAGVDRPGIAPDHIDLSLAAVARMFHVSPLTLLCYELRGAVRRRRSGGRSVYTWTDCDRIAFIIKSRRLGIPFADIDAIVSVAAGRRTPKVVHQAKRQCAELIQALQNHRLDVDEMIGELEHRCMSLPPKVADERSGHEGHPAL